MRKKDSCYWRTRSPQDVIGEQTEGPRTISINEIYTGSGQAIALHTSFFVRSSSSSLLLPFYFIEEFVVSIRNWSRIRNSVSSNRVRSREKRMWDTGAKRVSLLARRRVLEDVFLIVEGKGTKKEAKQSGGGRE